VDVGGVLALTSRSNLASTSQVILQESANTLAPGTLVLADPSLDPASLVSSASTGGVVALGNLNWTTALDLSQIGNGKQSLGAGSPTSVYAAASLYPGSDGNYRLGNGTVAGVLTLNGADNVLSGPYGIIVGQDPGYSSVPTGSSANGVILACANNFTGGTTLYGGSLALGNDGALGSGTLTFVGGDFGSAGGARTIANPVVLGTVALTVAGDLTFTGSVNLNGGTGVIGLGGPYGTGKITFSNVISNGALTLQSGTFTFTGANTFAGGLTVSDAHLFIANESNLGAAGASLNLADGKVSPIGSALTINRPVNCTYSYSGIYTNGGVVTLNGPVTASNSGINLTKNDAGTLILTNPSNNVPMNVVSGTLQVDNVAGGKTPTAVQITVTNGTLAGTGLVGNTSVSNGHIAPGDSGQGTLTITGGLLLFGAPMLDFNLGTQAAAELVLSNASIFQFLDTANPATIVVNISNAGGLAPGQTYNLVNWGSTPTSGITASAFELGSSPVGGTFNITSAGVLQFTTAAYTPYQQWQSTYFGSINNASAAPGADPANDGISNLLKYALGLDPLHVATAGLPQVGSLSGYLTLTYSRPDSVTDILYVAKSSNDLATWSSSAVVQEVLSDDGATQTIRAKIPSAGTAREFLRLMVTMQ
jgi:fibronectin-binding autotransporter adhesin